jgi:copper chaperone NosL
MIRQWTLCLAMLTAVACGGVGGRAEPAALDTRHDACAACRMSVSSRTFAAQIVAPGEEPLFFDDIGCLARYLTDQPRTAPGAVAYVADHRTGAWVPAATAIYTTVPTMTTPMDSHIVAHASAASRDADAEARHGTHLTAATVFGRPVPGGAP